MIANRYLELFQENVVMTMDHLKAATGRPRESILRELKGIGYYSSYNERGKYYTLDSIPEFDEIGLWKYQHAYFSARRTLLDTAEYLVSSSDAGHTHDELRQVLGIGIQNSLYQLTMEGKIVRRQFGAQYVYFGKESACEQGARRGVMPFVPIVRKPAKSPDVRICPNVDPLLVIDILVAALRGNDTEPEALAYLHRTGSPATAQHVATVFRHYDIAKKTLRSRSETNLFLPARDLPSSFELAGWQDADIQDNCRYLHVLRETDGAKVFRGTRDHHAGW